MRHTHHHQRPRVVIKRFLLPTLITHLIFMATGEHCPSAPLVICFQSHHFLFRPPFSFASYCHFPLLGRRSCWITRLILIRFYLTAHCLIALGLFYQTSFESISFRRSVWPQMGRKVAETPKDGADSGRFCEFAVRRFVRSQRTQKQSCRAFQ